MLVWVHICADAWMRTCTQRQGVRGSTLGAAIYFSGKGSLSLVDLEFTKQVVWLASPKELPVSAHQVLGLQTRVTMPRYFFKNGHSGGSKSTLLTEHVPISSASECGVFIAQKRRVSQNTFFLLDFFFFNSGDRTQGITHAKHTHYC